MGRVLNRYNNLGSINILTATIRLNLDIPKERDNRSLGKDSKKGLWLYKKKLEGQRGQVDT